MTKNRLPRLIDKHIGSKLKQRRMKTGLTQIQLAKAVNLTFQQIQKYEKARNRINAGILYELAKVLGIEIQYFFDGFREKEVMPLPGFIGYISNQVIVMEQPLKRDYFSYNTSSSMRKCRLL